MKNLVVRFANDESGATAIEYGLIAVGIALAVFASASSVGTALSGMFTTIAGNLNGAGGGGES